MKNPDFVKRFLGGDGDARREMMAADIVIANSTEGVA